MVEKDSIVLDVKKEADLLHDVVAELYRRDEDELADRVHRLARLLERTFILHVGQFRLRVSTYAVGVGVEGYGEKTAIEGMGSPVYVDLPHSDEDVLKVWIWSDINEEEPTHRIDLDGAAEKYYEGEEDVAPENV